MFGDYCYNKREITNSAIENGTPIVAESNFFPFYQFGIFVDGYVIQQKYDIYNNITIYESVLFDSFHFHGHKRLYEYVPKIFSYDRSRVVERAHSQLNVPLVNGFPSIFGDDFVFWCLVGEYFWSYFTYSKLGLHYSEKYREGILNLFHHAIAIEQDIIIHFTDKNGLYETPEILIDSFNELKCPKIVEYRNDSLGERWITRNRALLLWATRNSYKKYNIVLNNCEHFATYCRTGRAESFQVQNALFDIATLGLTAFAPRFVPFAVKRLMKYFI